MKITSVSYRTNRPTTGSRYVHEHVELVAQIGAKETPAQARVLLYPELRDLRSRLQAASPLVSNTLGDYGDTELAALYEEHAETFSKFLRGDLAPRSFLAEVG